MVEKRISMDEIKIKGKQTELRNMISYMQYVGIMKSFVKYSNCFVELNSSLIDNNYKSFLSVFIKETPDLNESIFGSISWFILFIIISELFQRITFKTQKSLNIAALFLFNFLTFLVFFAISSEMALSENPTYHNDL